MGDLIQVYLGDNFVGVLSGVRIVGDVIHLLMPAELILNSPTLSNAAVEIDVLTICTKNRSCVINDRDLWAQGVNHEELVYLFKKRHHIPEDAEVSKMMETMSTQFRWRVATPTLSEYETIFDFPQFEPI